MVSRVVGARGRWRAASQRRKRGRPGSTSSATPRCTPRLRPAQRCGGQAGQRAPGPHVGAAPIARLCASSASYPASKLNVSSLSCTAGGLDGRTRGHRNLGSPAAVASTLADVVTVIPAGGARKVDTLLAGHRLAANHPAAALGTRRWVRSGRRRGTDRSGRRRTGHDAWFGGESTPLGGSSDGFSRASAAAVSDAGVG